MTIQLFIKQLIQLLLVPARGWEDISRDARNGEEVARKGYLPWLGVVAASEIIRVFYHLGPSFLSALERAIGIYAALFASLYLGKLFLELTLPGQIGNKINPNKIYIFTIYLTALMGLFHFLGNIIPTDLTLIKLLPLLSLVISFKATDFMGISSDKAMTFVGLAAVAIILLPAALSALLLFII